jgi:hypothetical protein
MLNDHTGGNENACRTLFLKPEGRDHLEDLDIDRRAMFKFILRK